MYYLSVCAVAKHEMPYIEEWFKFHIGVGVDHFYIYDNSDDNELAKFASPTITVDVVSGGRMQPYVYNTCLTTYKFETRWLAFIDIDEFLVPKKVNSLKEILPAYEKYPALCPHWKFFGSAGQLEYSNKPVIERFTKCQVGTDEHVKSIVNPKVTFKYINPHRFTHVLPPVDEHENPIDMYNAKPTPYTSDIIQVNHYATKSIGECTERRKRPRMDTGEVRNLQEFLLKHDRNESEDLRALELWRKINGTST